MGFILRHSNCEFEDYLAKHVFSNVWGDSCDEMVLSTLLTPFEGTHVVLGFYNGIFLLEYVNGHVVVWNPLLSQFTVLPPPPIMNSPPCSNSHCDGTCRVKVVSLVCGIGFVPHSGDYKVLRITSNYYHHPKECPKEYPVCLKQAQAYSVANNCWEEIEIDSDDEYNKYEVIGSSIYIGGFCYWKSEMDDGGHVIASFSFITHKFSIFDVPPIILDESFEYEHDLVEMEGTLGIVVYPTYGNVKRFSFLVLRGGSWARNTKYDVRVVGAKRFLGMSYDNMLLLEGREGELLVYDYKKKKLNRIYQVYDYPLEMSVFPYAGTVTPLPDGKIAASTLEYKTRKEIKRDRPPLVPTLGGEGSQSTTLECQSMAETKSD